MKKATFSCSRYKIILQIIFTRIDGGQIVELVFTFQKALKSLK